MGPLRLRDMLTHRSRWLRQGGAFHWFDRERAMVEFRRILKPEGWLCKVDFWANADETRGDEAFEQTSAWVYGRLRERAHAHMRRMTRSKTFARDSAMGRLRARWLRLGGAAWADHVAVDHMLGISAMRPRHREFERELRAYFEQLSVDGKVIWQTTVLDERRKIRRCDVFQHSMMLSARPASEVSL